jgi:hypothetical protein
MVMESGDQLHERCAIKWFWDAGECGIAALFPASGTVM